MKLQSKGYNELKIKNFVLFLTRFEVFHSVFHVIFNMSVLKKIVLSLTFKGQILD